MSCYAKSYRISRTRVFQDCLMKLFSPTNSWPLNPSSVCYLLLQQRQPSTREHRIFLLRQPFITSPLPPQAIFVTAIMNYVATIVPRTDSTPRRQRPFSSESPPLPRVTINNSLTPHPFLSFVRMDSLPYTPPNSAHLIICWREFSPRLGLNS